MVRARRGKGMQRRLFAAVFLHRRINRHSTESMFLPFEFSMLPFVIITAMSLLLPDVDTACRC